MSFYVNHPCGVRFSVWIFFGHSIVGFLVFGRDVFAISGVSIFDVWSDWVFNRRVLGFPGSEGFSGQPTLFLLVFSMFGVCLPNPVIGFLFFIRSRFLHRRVLRFLGAKFLYVAVCMLIVKL